MADAQSLNNQQKQQWSRQTLLRSSYQDLGTPETVGKRFQHYLLTNPSTLNSILCLLTSQSTTDDGKTRIKDYSLPIDLHELLSHDPVLGHMLLRHPTTLLPLLEDAVVEAQRELVSSVMAISKKKSFWSSVKGDDDTRIHARLIHLPPHSSSCRPLISSLTSLDVGKILQLSGTVVRASKIQMYESQRAFRCCSGTNKSINVGGSRWKKRQEEGCGASFVVKADLLQWNNALCAPSRYVPTRSHFVLHKYSL